MTRYRKKPVTVEAFRLKLGERVPLWFEAAMHAKTVEPLPGEVGGLNGWGTEGAVIHSPRFGMLTANLGDWIVRTDAGEMSVCTADEFAATYEVAE